ncbi:hypothetical protein KHQ06_32320 [Nocardia tengchongensis]|uniref:Uncharacterized protein n=1 Tax=Nocardia tengchongensis TaxID=2055889 RepID=A0ABX8CMC6_9NOCA|nr:hypothetical protein [Nocardia tengchongensis]QVI20744.1 hypothetical protein KHQ06_32320 [Nocardia tengchongensis]
MVGVEVVAVDGGALDEGAVAGDRGGGGVVGVEFQGADEVAASVVADHYSDFAGRGDVDEGLAGDGVVAPVGYGVEEGEVVGDELVQADDRRTEGGDVLVAQVGGVELVVEAHVAGLPTPPILLGPIQGPGDVEAVLGVEGDLLLVFVEPGGGHLRQGRLVEDFDRGRSVAQQQGDRLRQTGLGEGLLKLLVGEHRNLHREAAAF